MTPSDRDLPASFGVVLSSRVQVCDGGRSLVGGGSVLRLAPPAAEVVARLPAVVGSDPVVAAVARLLLEKGAADPWWATAAGEDEAVDDVTVVVPVLGRADALATLLASLPAHLPVVVVDDGSPDPAPLARVAASHGARVVRHEVNRGPAAARNTGLRAAGTPYVAFVDSDVAPQPGWLATLRRHLDDPGVAVAGPRVLGLAGNDRLDRLDGPDGVHGRGPGWVERYEQDRSSLDLGPLPAAVRVHGAVAYLPSACLLARVEALLDDDRPGFDEDLRSGEDVDLVWRLLARGWAVRYEPAAVVRHDHRVRLLPWLARKAFYGTSAAPLAERHPRAVAPLVATPWTVVWTVALLAQRRWSAPLAVASLAVAVTAIARRLEGSEHPVKESMTLGAEGAVAATWQTASALTRHHWPLAALWAARSRRGRRALLVAAVAEGLADRRRVGSSQPVIAYVVAHRLDDLAYGVGLWQGVLRARSARALLPVLRRGRRPRPRP